MKSDMFEELFGSVREAGAILRGRENTLTQDLHWFFRRPGDSRANQPLTVGVCAFDWCQRQDASKLGTGPPLSRGPAAALLRIIAHDPQLAVKAIHGSSLAPLIEQRDRRDTLSLNAFLGDDSVCPCLSLRFSNQNGARLLSGTRSWFRHDGHRQSTSVIARERRSALSSRAIRKRRQKKAYPTSSSVASHRTIAGNPSRSFPWLRKRLPNSSSHLSRADRRRIKAFGTCPKSGTVS